MSFNAMPGHGLGWHKRGPFNAGLYGPLPSQHLFRETGPFGVDRLPPGLTINGVTVVPTLRYKGGDATTLAWPQWVYGSELAIAGAGSAVTPNQGSPLLGPNDDSVLYNNGKYHLAGDTDLGQMGTRDITIEAFLRIPENGSNEVVIRKRAGTDDGWLLRVNSAGTVSLFLDNGPLIELVSAALTPGAWYHYLAFVNRDEASANGSQAYVNATASGAGVDFSSVAGDITNAVAAEVGLNLTSPLAYLAVWFRDSWHQAGAAGPTEWATIAKERFHQLCGTYPTRALGTKVPTSFVRTTTAYLDKYDPDGYRRMYLVGAGHPRVVHRKDSNSTSIKGYLPETAVTNRILQSETFDNAVSWAKVRATATANSAVAPNKRQVADTMVEDGTATTHLFAQDVSHTAAEYYNFSLWAKKINRDWIALEVQRSGTNALVFFDLTNGVVGSTPAGTQAQGIEYWRDGWYRCWLMMLADATASQTHSIYIAEADNDLSFNGLSQDSLYIFGAQVENERRHPRSYIPTVGGTVTRDDDRLRYKLDDGNLGGVGSNQRGSMFFRTLKEPIYGGNSVIWGAISDGGASVDRIKLQGDSDGLVDLTTAASGGNPGSVTGTVDVMDNVKHQVGCTWQTDNLNLFVDDSLDGTPDTSVDCPDDLDRFDVGADVSGITRLDGVIADLRLYPYPTSAPKG